MELFDKLFTVTTLAWALGIVGALVALYILPRLKVTEFIFKPVYVLVRMVKNAYIQGVLTRLVDLLKVQILAAENTLIEDLKQKAKDGTITKEELIGALAKVKEQVLANVKTHASMQGIYSLALKIFMGDEKALTGFLGDTLEGLVAQLPASGLQTSKDGVTPPAIDTQAVVTEVTAQTVAAILPR